jgi:hypothetical protein
MKGAKRAGGDQGGAGPGAAGDAVEAGGFKGFGQHHRRQDGGEPVHQHPGLDPTLPAEAQVHPASGDR